MLKRIQEILLIFFIRHRYTALLLVVSLTLALLFTAVFFGAIRSATAQEAANWKEPYIYRLVDEFRVGECGLRGCNLTPAIERAEVKCKAELVGTTWNRPATGCKFIIPAGDHTITKTVRSCLSHTFEGVGGRPRRSFSTITATQSHIHGRGFGDCAQGSFAGSITIKNLGLIAPSGPHVKPIVAVKAEAKIHMENVWIIYADVGVWITADVTRTPKSNANSSRLINVAVEYTRHAGMIFNGGDSNAHAIIAPNISTSCMAKYNVPEMTALTAEFGPCGGYVDRSFLGNFAVAGHFAAAEGYPDILISGNSNHGTCLGCYVEGQTPPELAAQWSQWIGGIGPAPLGPGFRLDGNRTTSLRVWNDLDPNNQVTFEMGRATGTAGTFYGLRQTTNNWPLRMKWLPTFNSGSYLEDVGNASAGRVRSIRATRNGNSPPGGDSDALGRTKHWDVEAILGQ